MLPGLFTIGFDAVPIFTTKAHLVVVEGYCKMSLMITCEFSADSVEFATFVSECCPPPVYRWTGKDSFSAH